MPAVIDRVGESRTNNELAAALAARLGSTPRVPRRRSAPRADATVPFDAAGVTPSRPGGGTVQFRDTVPDRTAGPVWPGSTRSACRGTARSTSDYPLSLISPATPRTINSMFGEFQRPGSGRCASIPRTPPPGASPTATRCVFNDRAELTDVAAVDADLRPGVVSMPKGLWCRDFAGRAHRQRAAPGTLSDLAGGACFNDARVEVAAGNTLATVKHPPLGTGHARSASSP